MESAKNVLMERDGEQAEVANNSSVQIMEALGWKVADASKPSDGLKVEEIKAALAAKGIEIPDGVTLKADLAALLDASA